MLTHFSWEYYPGRILSFHHVLWSGILWGSTKYFIPADTSQLRMSQILYYCLIILAEGPPDIIWLSWQLSWAWDIYYLHVSSSQLSFGQILYLSLDIPAEDPTKYYNHDKTAQLSTSQILFSASSYQLRNYQILCPCRIISAEDEPNIIPQYHCSSWGSVRYYIPVETSQLSIDHILLLMSHHLQSPDIIALLRQFS